MGSVPGERTDGLEENPGTEDRYSRYTTGEASKKYYCPDCSELVKPLIKSYQSRKHGRWMKGMSKWVCPGCAYSALPNEFVNWTDTVRYWKREGKDEELEGHGIE